MAINCHFCGSPKLRPSRFRSLDLPHSLLLRFPVRCRSCGERTYASLNQFLKLRGAQSARRKPNAGVS